MMNKALSYRDIALTPRYSTLRSRSEADVSVEFLGRKLALPITPSNMESVINVDIACWLSENQFAYIYHRFGDTYDFVDRANKEGWNLISISIGVKDVDKGLLRALVEKGLRVDWITIDVAMGHHVLVKEMIEFIKALDFKSALGDYVSDSWAIQDGVAGPGRGFASIPLSYRPKIIAGNVATPEGVRDLASWGASCVKIGVAGGAACHTRQKTGFHVPMFTCAQRCSETGYFDTTDTFRKSYVPLIFDGGVREIGDIVKGLVAGGGASNLVMAGSLFAACTDAPGESHLRLDHDKVHRITHKSYHGSASSRQKNERRHVEGVELEIPCNGMTIKELYQDIRESLQSACSYAGTTNLAGLKDVQYVEVK